MVREEIGKERLLEKEDKEMRGDQSRMRWGKRRKEGR